MTRPLKLGSPGFRPARRALSGALSLGALAAVTWPASRGAHAAVATGALATGGVVAPPVPHHGGLIEPPVPIPDITVRLHDGRNVALRRLMSGHLNVVQLMFTGCTTTCPIQGHVFQRVQQLLDDRPSPPIQLISISISPLEDTPALLRAWLQRFDAGPGWIAASPRPEDLDAVLNMAGSTRGIESHATRVDLVSPRAELIWRTYELPSPESIVALLRGD